MILKKREKEIFVVGGQSTVLIPATGLRAPTATAATTTAPTVVYVIEGYCTGDWSLSAAEEQWVEKLRQDEINDLCVFNDQLRLDTGSSTNVNKDKKKVNSQSKVTSPINEGTPEQAT